MVSTSFSRESQLALSLPNAEGQKAETDQDLIEISIDANGVYFVNGVGLVDNSKETLVRALLKISAADKSKPIIISADAKANYQAAITAMDAAGIAGFSNLSLATREGSN